MRIEFLASRPDRAGRYTMRLSDGSSMRLYRQTIEDHGLFSDMELSEEQVEMIRRSAGEMSAKMRAVRIVTASAVSRQDLEDRLIRKGEQPDQAKEAVRWMCELEFVDDKKTAMQIVSRCASRGYGIARAKQALFEKRIPKELWEKALEDYPDQTEYIENFLRSRLREDWEERDLKRAVDALLRRGHGYGDIRCALRRLEVHDFQEE
jgi:regulatory protein